MLGAIDQSYLFGLLERIALRDGKGLMEQARGMAERSLSFESALQELATVLHQIAVKQIAPDAPEDVAPEDAEIGKFAGVFSAEDIQVFYQIVILGRRDLPLAPDEFSGFTMTLMRMLAFVVDANPGRKVATISNSPKYNPPSVDHEEKKESLHPPSSVVDLAVETTRPEPSAAVAVDRSVSFDGNWLGLVGKLKLAGMAGMLAMHCELKSFSGRSVELSVPQEHKHLAEKVFIDKLQTALANYFGAEIVLKVAIGQSSGNTLAEVEERGRQAKQAEAQTAIGQDVFVRDLVENLDARVIESSIRPIQQ